MKYQFLAFQMHKTFLRQRKKASLNNNKITSTQRSFKSPSKIKTGYVFPVILLATLAVGGFILTLTQLQSSNRQKYQHLNNYQAAFNIAYSALVEILAEIQAKQWSNRSFKGSPYSKNETLFGGSYYLWAEDYDTAKYLFNVKIRVNYKQKKHFFYWRLMYNPNLLDFTKLFTSIYFGHFANESSANISKIDKLVDEKLKHRQENQEKIIKIADQIRPSATIKDALKKIGIKDNNLNDGDKKRPKEPQLVIPKKPLPLKDLDKLKEKVAPEVDYAIKDFRFKPDDDTLDAEQKSLLDSLAKVLKKRPEIKIELRGHTTGVVGTPESNIAFSIERAKSIADYLESCGIPANRMTIKGLGATQLIASNNTAEGKAKNRRVEFVLLK